MFSLLPADPFYRILWIIIFLGWISTSVFWSLAMIRAIEKIDPALRRMRPEQVWLVLIPGFGLFWQFYIVHCIAQSLRDEFMRRNYIPREASPGMSSGLSANILFSFVLLPPLGIPLAIISFIPRLIHLIRIRKYTDELAHIIEVQNAYAAQEKETDINAILPPPEVKPENENPERFQRPMTEEENWERWRKKD